MGNFDDIEGPGNNSYLYFDPDTGVATVVAWDHNLAFGGLGGGGGGGPTMVGPGGGGFPPGGTIDLPEGCEPPVDFQPGEMPEGGMPGGGPGMMNGSNILVERFNAVPEFAAMYDAAVDGTDGRAVHRRDCRRRPRRMGGPAHRAGERRGERRHDRG